ncbi:MAG: hypothetical protein LBR54_02200 [Oscillospiraceae bacterium]|jgi:hypothetical protein|nr:hypothetical protein [Oscillospiraceae bacterium]
MGNINNAVYAEPLNWLNEQFAVKENIRPEMPADSKNGRRTEIDTNRQQHSNETDRLKSHPDCKHSGSTEKNAAEEFDSVNDTAFFEHSENNVTDCLPALTQPGRRQENVTGNSKIEVLIMQCILCIIICLIFMLINIFFTEICADFLNLFKTYSREPNTEIIKGFIDWTVAVFGKLSEI